MKNTKIINFISGPGVGKSVLAAALFVKMKVSGYNVEYIQEYAKNLIWTGNFDILNNQYYVSQQQYNLFKSMIGKVDYIITDGPLIHGIYYNKNNNDNVSDKIKTESKILEYIKEFDNINIFLDRNESIRYEQEGRLQTFNEALEVDKELKKILKNNGLNYYSFLSELDSTNNILEFIKNKK